MGVQINRISVRNLGPLNDFDQKFNLINLIYAHNEKGKTFLVEFIYKSLFKNKALSNLRSFSANGQIAVSGLRDRVELFSPTSRKKLEDFWDEDKLGLPKDFSKLLVVKGGQLDLSNANFTGIDDQILKEFLSGEILLERIRNKIKTTESSATYVDGQIIGNQRGMVKEYYELRDQLQQVDQYFQEINSTISGGKRFEIKKEIDKIQKQLDNQDKAKRYLAYILAQKISALNEILDALQENLLREASEEITSFQQKMAELERKIQALEENKKKSKHFLWLEAAVAEYQQLINSGVGSSSKVGMILIATILVAVLLSIFLILLNQPYFSIITICIATLLSYFNFRHISKQKSNELLIIETRKIENNFIERFDYKGIVSLPVLEGKFNELKSSFFSLDSIAQDIEAYSVELEVINQRVDHVLEKLGLKKCPSTEWREVISLLQKKRIDTDNDIRKLQNELSRLNIEEDEYLRTPNYQSDLDKEEKSQIPVKENTPEYDREIQNNLIALKKNLEIELHEIENELQQVKQSVCAFTNSKIDISWEDLIEKLTKRQNELSNKYKEITATIIAQINVFKILEEYKKIEEGRIAEALSSPIVEQSLITTTGHYNHIEKDGNELIIGDQYGEYRIGDLSTGAREQVLLGLRIGFASNLLAGQPMFLLLDDAFQHSDWERRELLVDKVSDLAKTGWQITYFTMDDHIRNLFEKKIKPFFNDQYQYIQLDTKI